MATLVEKFFDSKDELTAELSHTLEQSLRDGIKSDGRAVLMVSGGSSPAPAYKHLSTLDLDWQNANFITMKNDAATAEQGAQVCEAAYSALKAPYDVTILGMGPDGHTASLFPHAQGLEHGLTTQQTVCAINAIESDVTGSITERMTLTLNAIANSKVVKLLISGEEKLAVYKQAKAGGDVNDMPLRAVLNHPSINIEVYWAP